MSSSMVRLSVSVYLCGEDSGSCMHDLGLIPLVKFFLKLSALISFDNREGPG